MSMCDPPKRSVLFPSVSFMPQEFNISINCKHLYSFVPSRRLYQQLVHYPQVTHRLLLSPSLLGRRRRLGVAECL